MQEQDGIKKLTRGVGRENRGDGPMGEGNTRMGERYCLLAGDEGRKNNEIVEKRRKNKAYKFNHLQPGVGSQARKHRVLGTEGTGSGNTMK